MSRGFEKGDRVVALENMGTGAGKGELGTIVHVAFHHGLLEVTFDSGRRVVGVRHHQIARA